MHVRVPAADGAASVSVSNYVTFNMSKNSLRSIHQAARGGGFKGGEGVGVLIRPQRLGMPAAVCQCSESESLRVEADQTLN